VVEKLNQTPLSQQITTITFFKYNGFRNKLWAFKMMQFAHVDLSKVAGCSFYKLMGSGKGIGFNPLPDWSVYSLLQIWESEAAANTFFTENALTKKYENQTAEMWTLYMRNISAGGAWSGGNPFEKSSQLSAKNPAIAVITRATIKWSMLPQFWKYVPVSHQSLAGNEGLIYTKGIGEVPILQMATFSLWKDLESVKKFAYESKEHQVAIQKTRRLEWYSEELFSRFQPYKELGSWGGKQLLSI
jgi:heme-degrading monooxygenase HmoA